MPRRVELSPYNPSWPQMFREEAESLAAVFGEQLVAVHHIGSTAIPGILAKPIIDILVVVRDIERVDAFNDALAQLGYVAKGEFGIPGRRFFIKGNEAHRSHHVHVFQDGHSEIERHLEFRDYLLAHSEDARAYERLKQKLARKYPEDVDRYTKGKDEFIRQTNHKAKEWRSGSV